MQRLKTLLLPLAFLQAVVAMTGSLYFSEVMHLVPCVLCWYQRITMYPLVLITLVGLLRKDAKIYQYVLPLSITGFLIASYHVLLYYGILPESIAPCQAGISCTTRTIEWFSFVTIPLLSWTAHLVISVLMGLAWRVDRKGN
jgi:disulfide bond formation protein DsbB